MQQSTVMRSCHFCHTSNVRTLASREASAAPNAISFTHIIIVVDGVENAWTVVQSQCNTMCFRGSTDRQSAVSITERLVDEVSRGRNKYFCSKHIERKVVSRGLIRGFVPDDTRFRRFPDALPHSRTATVLDSTAACCTT